jgi:hypothetical protein
MPRLQLPEVHWSLPLGQEPLLIFVPQLVPPQY